MSALRRLSKLRKWTKTSLVHRQNYGLHSFAFYRNLSTRKLVLGIETSCDDTGAAVVDQNGTILGEALNSQTRTHVSLGGIIPPIARDLHKQNIDTVVQDALTEAQIEVSDLDAIAVTVEPGLVVALRVGLNKAVELCKQAKKPLIAVHHMKAHALTVRIQEKIDFPFMVLLASGGHCLLAVCHNPDEFSLLGSSCDDAPGECLDKIARRLKLKNIPEFSAVSGGQAIEKLAENGDPKRYVVHTTMAHRADCMFSFAGIKSHFHRIIDAQESEQNVRGDGLLNNIPDICASAQYSIGHHICRRVQRGLAFCEMRELLPERKTLVLSGGVGSNQFIRRCLEKICEKYDCRLVCPPPKLCTDNGVMIAWTGMEKLVIDSGLTFDYDNLDVNGKSPMGIELYDDVESCQIKPQRIKLLDS